MRKQSAPGKQGDLYLRLTAVQLVLCGLILLLVFAAMKKSAPLFESMRQEFLQWNATDWDPGSFRFFDFGSAGEKRESEAAASTGENAEETAPSGAQATAGEGETGAGGADLSSDEIQSNVSFAFYDAGAEVVLPVNGHATSGFGARIHPIYGTEGFHSGKDIAAPEGTPVYAAMDGHVSAVGRGEMSGNYVKLRHENGVETLYCHLQSANVAEGVAVRRGDVIGFVGQTGLATGPHLHFEVHIDGVKRDPDFLLEGAAVVS